MVFYEILDAYCKTRMRSWKRYRLSLRHITKHLGNVPLKDFRRRHAHEFVELRKQELSEVGADNPDQSPLRR